MKQLDLDVDAPEKVPQVLRMAADVFMDARAELQSAWQSRHAGKEWEKIALILRQAADKIDKALKLNEE